MSVRKNKTITSVRKKQTIKGGKEIEEEIPGGGKIVFWAETSLASMQNKK